MLQVSGISYKKGKKYSGRDRETKFELSTEFDTATLTDREVYTTANVG